MKLPKRVYITKAVCEQIKKARMKSFGKNYTDDGIEDLHQALLFLLGANKTGVVKKAIQLQEDDGDGYVEGCEYMPGINEEIMRKAYFKLAKENLRVIGFAHKIHKSMLPRLSRIKWDYTMGDLMYDFPGFVMIRFHPEPKAIGFLGGKRTQWIPLTIRSR